MSNPFKKGCSRTGKVFCAVFCKLILVTIHGHIAGAGVWDAVQEERLTPLVNAAFFMRAQIPQVELLRASKQFMVNCELMHIFINFNVTGLL